MSVLVRLYDQQQRGPNLNGPKPHELLRIERVEEQQKLPFDFPPFLPARCGNIQTHFPVEPERLLSLVDQPDPSLNGGWFAKVKELESLVER